MKPDFVFLNGDIIDFYPISRFDRDPERKLRLQSDIDDTKNFFASLRAATPSSHIIMTLGNHEDRLRRYLLSQAEELACLEDLQFDRLLRLADYGISLVPRNKALIHHDIVVTHGDRVRSRAGYSAHAMLDKFGASGASGHTHRAAKVCRTTLAGRKTWVEGGCLCNLSADYIDGCTDWQQAVTVGYTMDGHTELDLVMVHNGTILFDGILFGGTNAERGTAPRSGETQAVSDRPSEETPEGNPPAPE